MTELTDSSSLARSLLLESNGTTPASLRGDALSNITLTATAQDNRQAYSGSAQAAGYEARLNYQWQLLSSTCDTVRFNSPTNQTTNVTLASVGTSTVRTLSLLL
jgi:hypothetical protein